MARGCERAEQTINEISKSVFCTLERFLCLPPLIRLINCPPPRARSEGTIILASCAVGLSWQQHMARCSTCPTRIRDTKHNHTQCDDIGDYGCETETETESGSVHRCGPENICTSRGIMSALWNRKVSGWHIHCSRSPAG